MDTSKYHQIHHHQLQQQQQQQLNNRQQQQQYHQHPNSNVNNVNGGNHVPLNNNKGHYRSSSLENNIYAPIKSSYSPQHTNYTGTLKSKREQRRINEMLNNRMSSVDDLNNRKSQFRLIRDIFEQNKTNSNATQSSLNISEDKPPKIQSCSGVLEEGKQVIRPIAFKPTPYTPDCQHPNHRFSDLGERYGSTPSLGPHLGTNFKFGSTSDLRYNYNLGNRKSIHYFNAYDSLESISKSPDSIATSHSTLKSIGQYNPDHLDMTPSPSDSGISELEAALRDRDSELAYLRQTMEHNEKVIFKVHQDKEKHWEDEVKRIKIIHENRLRANAQKIQKLEQMLMMQSFQLRQNKKRSVETSERLNDEISEMKEQNEHYRNELCHVKIIEKDLKEQNSDLLEEVSILRRLVDELKGRFEESEWTICQKSGESALLKTQLRDAQNDLQTKDQEIAQLRVEIRAQNWEDRLLKKSEIQREVDIDLEISQLNRIIILKDQVIMAMTNELQKLRKEISDMVLFNSYDGIPPGRHTKFKKDFFYFMGSHSHDDDDDDDVDEDGDGDGDGSGSSNVGVIIKDDENNDANISLTNDLKCDENLLNSRANNLNEVTNQDSKEKCSIKESSELAASNYKKFYNNIDDDLRRNDLQEYQYLNKIHNSCINRTNELFKPNTSPSHCIPDASVSNDLTGIFLNNQILNCHSSSVNMNNFFNITQSMLQIDRTSSGCNDGDNYHPLRQDEGQDDIINNLCDKLKDIAHHRGVNSQLNCLPSNENDNTTVGSNDDNNYTDKNIPGMVDTDETINNIVLKENLKLELNATKANFEKERIKWAEEKEKVLIYQRQLQFNYLQMLKRTQLLEEKLKLMEKSSSSPDNNDSLKYS